MSSAYSQICEAVGIDPKGYCTAVDGFRGDRIMSAYMECLLGQTEKQPDEDTPKRDAIMSVLESVNEMHDGLRNKFVDAVEQRCALHLAVYETASADLMVRALDAEEKLRRLQEKST